MTRYSFWARFGYGVVVALSMLVTALLSLAIYCNSGWPRLGNIPFLLMYGYPLWIVMGILAWVFALVTWNVERSRMVTRLSLVIPIVVCATLFVVFARILPPCSGFNP